jgi:hypothetical protein
MTKARGSATAQDRREAHAEAGSMKVHGASDVKMTTRGGGIGPNQQHDADVEGKRTPDVALISHKRPAAPTSSSDSEEEAMMVKRAKKNWSADAVRLGYEEGTIKHSAYILLAESGTTGMTVASIVGTAQRLSMYSWGACKTPNNSVTAALSQDSSFVRIAPSTYCLRSQLRGIDGEMPAPRTSSGSHDSGTTGLGNQRHADSGNSGRGRQSGKRQVAAQPKPRAESPMHFVLDDNSQSEYDEADDVVNIQVIEDAFDRFDRVGEVKRTADALADESYRRRMDVYGRSVAQEFADGSSFHFTPPEIVRPGHSPEASVAGSCLLYYPTANAGLRGAIPESSVEPTEATHRAVSWKDEAKRLHGSRQKTKASSSITLPTWVLEQYLQEHNQILCDDLVPTP